jgi:hypothetical protein
VLHERTAEINDAYQQVTGTANSDVAAADPSTRPAEPPRDATIAPAKRVTSAAVATAPTTTAPSRPPRQPKSADAPIAQPAPPPVVPLSYAGTVTIIEDSRTASMWDEFAGRCGASFRASHRAASFWQLDHHKRYKLRRVSVWLEVDGRRERIGQAALGIGSVKRVFAEGLEILPEFAHRWSEAMAALLAYFGSGTYHYGSQWSLEQAREDELELIEGVDLTDVHAVTVYAVPFAAWPNWDAYVRDVSSNAKRNAKKAEKAYPNLSIEITTGVSALRAAGHLIHLRRALYNRKDVAFSTVTTAVRFMIRAVLLGRESFTALARVGKKSFAAFGGVTFGANTYYMEGGSLRQNNGVNWFLLMRMLRDAYERSPKGHFVTGPYHENSPVDSGIDFFRHQTRALGYPTSEITFQYTA